MYRPLIILSLLCVMLSCKEEKSFNCQEIETYLPETRQMITDKQYAAALNRFIWFYQHAVEKCPNASSIRLSLGLNYWKELARVYPPALSAMKKTRDSTIRIFEKGNEEFETFEEIRILNEKLDEKERTVKLFDELNENDPIRARRYFFYMEDQLFEMKRYDLIVPFLEDPLFEFQRKVESYTKFRSPDTKTDSLNKQRFVIECQRLVDLCIYVKDMSKAKEIQERAMKIIKGS